jgi:hypothetical protein
MAQHHKGVQVVENLKANSLSHNLSFDMSSEGDCHEVEVTQKF